MNNSIVQAMRDRRLLELRYSGYARIGESHAYGRDNHGEEILRCFQTSGGSASGSALGGSCQT